MTFHEKKTHAYCNFNLSQLYKYCFYSVKNCNGNAASEIDTLFVFYASLVTTGEVKILHNGLKEKPETINWLVCQSASFRSPLNLSGQSVCFPLLSVRDEEFLLEKLKPDLTQQHRVGQSSIKFVSPWFILLHLGLLHPPTANSCLQKNCSGTGSINVLHKLFSFFDKKNDCALDSRILSLQLTF